MKLFLKGVLVGIGKIIPGFSGAIVAITLGVYEKMLTALNHPIRNTKFLIQISLGILVGIFLFSYIIDYLLDKYYSYTMLFFVGLVSGGIYSLFDRIKNKYTVNNIVLLVISFLIMIFIASSSSLKIFKSQNFLFWMIMGVLEAISTIVPGISGAAVLSIFDAYKPLIESIREINFSILFNFGIGMILGIISLIKLINFMFKKYNDKMYFMIIGLSISSVVILLTSILKFDVITSLKGVIVNLIVFTAGYLIGNKLEE